MSKRAMLWIVGVIAFGFTFLAAANVKQVYTYSTSGYLSKCSGIGNFSEWFDDSCSESLPPKLGVMALGLIVLVVCGYFAEKDVSRSVSAAARGGHDVRLDPSKNLYWCAEQGCKFESNAVADARLHRRETTSTATSPPPAPKPSGFEPPVQPATAMKAAPPKPASPPPASEYKTCPDCAEDVRAAARKCRFCGYMFEGSTLAESAS